MAAKRKKRSGGRRCQIKVVCGVKRRICRDAKGRIKSSKPVSKKRTAAKKRRKGASKRTRSCKYGKLKNPVGNRVCKKAPKGRAKGGKRKRVCKQWGYRKEIQSGRYSVPGKAKRVRYCKRY